MLKMMLKKKINISVISLYWNIGKVLSEDVLDGMKPEYGKNDAQTYLIQFQAFSLIVFMNESSGLN